MHFTFLLFAISMATGYCHRDSDEHPSPLIKRQLPQPIPLQLLPIPDFLNMGVCHKTIMASAMVSLPDLAAGIMPSAAQQLQSIKQVMDKVPYRAAPVSGDNLKTMSQLYRFGMFCGLSYCNGQQEMQNIAQVSLGQNSPLYMGRFKMQAVRDISQNRYIVVADDETKQIVVVWRGTINLGNIITDMDGAPIRDLPANLFPLKNARSKKSSNTQFFRGFVASLSPKIMQHFDADVTKAVKAHPGYQLIFAGHSLGGAQAVLAAMHWHLTQQQPKIAAIYTFGLPILGNNDANAWVWSELKPYNLVRAVSRGDIVPWARVKDSAQFPRQMEEVYLPSSKQAVVQPVICMGPMDRKCSAGIPCQQKQWVDHVWIGGISINPLQFCQLGRNQGAQAQAPFSKPTARQPSPHNNPGAQQPAT